MNREETTGIMIVLTGVIPLIGLFLASAETLRRGRRFNYFNRILIILKIWLLLCIIPLTIILQSSLMGYIVFFTLFSVLGFDI